jgi:hypothetical protein
MISHAFKTLPLGYQRVLWLIAAQFDGTNNGDLSLSRKQALAFGCNNERHRAGGLRELERRGLIVKTRAGGVRYGNKQPTLWALAWRAITHEAGVELDYPKLPPNGWRKFDDTQPACSTTRTLRAVERSDDTQPACSESGSTTRTLRAPLKTLGGVS